jgi:hypothetical protein
VHCILRYIWWWGGSGSLGLAFADYWIFAVDFGFCLYTNFAYYNVSRAKRAKSIFFFRLCLSLSVLFNPLIPKRLVLSKNPLFKLIGVLLSHGVRVLAIT